MQFSCRKKLSPQNKKSATGILLLYFCSAEKASVFPQIRWLGRGRSGCLYKQKKADGGLSILLCSMRMKVFASNMKCRAKKRRGYCANWCTWHDSDFLGVSSYICFYLSCCHLDRYQTGLGTRGSDTRKTSASSKKRPTCMQRGLQSMQPACPLTAARPTPHLLPIQQVSFGL